MKSSRITFLVPEVVGPRVWKMGRSFNADSQHNTSNLSLFFETFIFEPFTHCVR